MGPRRNGLGELTMTTRYTALVDTPVIDDAPAGTASLRSLGTSNPQPLGVASPGAATSASASDHVHAMPSASDVGAVPTARQVIAGTGLSGGGNLSADVTLAASFGALAGTVCEGNDARLSDARTPSTAGTNGGAMVYAGGAWASTAAGTARQVLTSNGSSAATWGQSVLPLRIGASITTALPADAALGLEWTVRSLVVRDTGDAAWLDVWRVDGSTYWQYGTSNATSSGSVLLAPSAGGLALRRGSTDHLAIDAATGNLTAGTSANTTTLRGSTMTVEAAPVCVIDDATTNAATTLLTLRHTTSGTAAAGIGTRILLQSEDAAGNTENVSAIDATLTNAGNGTEASAVDVLTRTGGGAVRRVARFTAGGSLLVGSAGATVDPGDSGIVMGLTKGLYIESAGVLYNAVGTFGGSTMTFGSGSFNVSIASFALSISAGQGTTVANGWLDIASGFRRRVTSVNNTNHTVTNSQSVIDMVALSAARTVTSPAAANGVIVTITNSDGSADGTKTVTFTPASGTVNGAASHVGVNTAYGSCTYWCNGTNWTIIAKVS